jgi:hypothetical protein
MISDGKNILLKIGLNSDVVEAWKRCYENYKDQPKKICKPIIGKGSIDDRCQAIFGYLCENVYYQLDKDGDQYIKSPARLLDDGCGDCKSLTMFIACCLHCCGIKCIVRFVNFDGGDQYTHVYPVSIDEYGGEIIMDMCETESGFETQGLPLYGYARPYKRKLDITYGR